MNNCKGEFGDLTYGFKIKSKYSSFLIQGNMLNFEIHINIFQMSDTAVSEVKPDKKISKSTFRETILADYKLANISRETSLLGRREVLTGKAKFGIFGDGKEIPQLAMAKYFNPGDFRSGYYRDQTFMMAIGQLTVEQFFAQLYANPSVKEEPASGGRSASPPRRAAPRP